MKRAISSIVFVGAVAFSFAGQGSFTIVRPLDGSTVREKTRILVPKNSVQDSGYIGIFLDGKFLEAVVPKESDDKKYLEYMLDTKAYEDGNHKLELKYYVDYNSQPRVVDSSSIDIVIGNKKGIEVPEDGIQMRYKFNVGSERIYKLQQKQITSIISEADQKKSGARPFEFNSEGEAITLLYAVDNKYGNGEGLMRMQVVPDRGVKNREYAFLTTSDATAPQRFYPESMAPIYMRLTPTGREVFGAVPDYFGFESAGMGGGDRFALYAAFPLPVLPSKSIRVGDSWRTNFQQGALDMAKLHTTNTVVEKMVDQARGEFVGVEWEMGRRCAVIKNTISQGTPTLSKKAGAATENISDRKVSVTETIWFDIDNGIIVKFYQDTTIEGKANFGLIGGGASGNGPSAPGAAGGRGKGPDDFSITDPFRQRGGKGGPPPAGMSGGGQKGGPQGAGMAGPAGMGGAQGGGQDVSGFVRTRFQRLFVLQK